MSSQVLPSTRGRFIESRSRTSGPLLDIGSDAVSLHSLATRYEALIGVLLAVGEYHDLGDLLAQLTTELGRVLRFDAIGLSQCDEIADRVDLHLAKIDLSVERGTDQAKERTTSAWIHEHHECRDTGYPSETCRTRSPSAQGTYVFRMMSGEGIKAYAALPLIRRNRILGVLELGRRRDEPFAADEVNFLTEVANQVS